MKTTFESDAKKTPANKKLMLLFWIGIALTYIILTFSHGYYIASKNITESDCSEEIPSYSSEFQDNPLKSLAYSIKKKQCSDDYNIRKLEYMEGLSNNLAIFDYCSKHSSLPDGDKARFTPLKVKQISRIKGEYVNFRAASIIEDGEALSEQWRNSSTSKENECSAQLTELSKSAGDWATATRDKAYAGYKLQGSALTYTSEFVNLKIRCDKNIGGNKLLYNISLANAYFLSRKNPNIAQQLWHSGMAVITDKRYHFDISTYDIKNEIGSTILPTKQIDSEFKETGVTANFKNVIKKGLLDDMATGIYLEWSSLDEEQFHTHTISPSEDFSLKYAEMLEMCK